MPTSPFSLSRSDADSAREGALAQNESFEWFERSSLDYGPFGTPVKTASGACGCHSCGCSNKDASTNMMASIPWISGALASGQNQVQKQQNAPQGGTPKHAATIINTNGIIKIGGRPEPRRGYIFCSQNELDRLRAAASFINISLAAGCLDVMKGCSDKIDELIECLKGPVWDKIQIMCRTDLANPTAHGFTDVNNVIYINFPKIDTTSQNLSSSGCRTKEFLNIVLFHELVHACGGPLGSPTWNSELDAKMVEFACFGQCELNTANAATLAQFCKENLSGDPMKIESQYFVYDVASGNVFCKKKNGQLGHFVTWAGFVPLPGGLCH